MNGFLKTKTSILSKFTTFTLNYLYDKLLKKCSQCYIFVFEGIRLLPMITMIAVIVFARFCILFGYRFF